MIIFFARKREKNWVFFSRVSAKFFFLVFFGFFWVFFGCFFAFWGVFLFFLGIFFCFSRVSAKIFGFIFEVRARIACGGTLSAHALPQHETRAVLTVRNSAATPDERVCAFH